MSHHDHHSEAKKSLAAISVGIITLSDTRTEQTDKSGHFLQDSVENDSRFSLSAYRLIKDDPTILLNTLDEFCSQEIDAILINGGTGLSKRDHTFQCISSCLEKTIPGFGELFRMLSYQEIGASAMLSRAISGTYRERLLFSMPGSIQAVKLAYQRLIAPELQHLIWELRR